MYMTPMYRREYSVQVEESFVWAHRVTSCLIW